MLLIEEALKIILDSVTEQDIEQVSLSKSLGRVLREEVVSDSDMPPFDRARMDGYAFKAIDTAGASNINPIRLRDVGNVYAGDIFNRKIESGEAVRIMTGAPVPDGADAVEKIESIDDSQSGFIELHAQVESDQFITHRGKEALKGSVMVSAGEIITPAVASVLAGFGYAKVKVSSRPRIALISTGSELVEVHETPGPSQIRNSNTYSLAGYAANAGCEIVRSFIARDDEKETYDIIAEALSISDVVILSGGVSMGDRDLVKPVLKNLGAEILVEQVAMHPGKPTVFATIPNLHAKYIFGLPGNPVSVAVSFHLFARPALLKIQGASNIHLPNVKAWLERDVKGSPPRRSHQPAKINIRDGKVFADPLKWSGSSDLPGFMKANALIVVPEDCHILKAGDLVNIILL